MIMLIAISLFVACLFLWAFVWSVKSGQFEDTVTPAVRILEEDDSPTFKEKDKFEHNGDDPLRQQDR
jgi:cbb3-type cytochrome oxidase maturation protein